MTVSILLATYNGENYISEQLDSILNQTYKDFILYISDDCSTDNTWNIINEYASKDSRIKIFSKHEPNKSACKHFLYMLEKIESDLYLFCDQDDVWTCDHVKAFVEKYNSFSNSEKQNPILLYSDLKIVDTNLNIISNSFFYYKNLPINPNTHFYFQMNNVTGCASMINNSLKQYVFYNSKLLKDNIDKIPMHDLFFAVIACEFGTRLFIPNSLVYYRQHGTNVLGAGEGWSFKLFLKKVFSFSQYKLSYYKHKNAHLKNKVFAAFFADYFKNKLKNEEYNALLGFSKLNEKNKISRMVFLQRNGFLTQNFIRNIWAYIVV